MCIGLLVFVLSLGLLFGADLLGWAVTTSVWTNPAKALAPTSKITPNSLPSFLSLATYVFLLAILLAGAKALRANLARFAAAFTAVFILSYACWFLGNWAYIAATPDKRQALKIGWSLNLTNESGFIIALLAGLLIANCSSRACDALREAIRPELYIKTAIVILGGFLGIAALEQRQLATSIMFLGACAIIAAYLIYWPIVYYVSRRYFGFSREWAAPLSSGISICGVSAAIATGSAIKARPVVPIMVSSLVVIFAVVELMVLPFAAQHFLYQPTPRGRRVDGLGGEDGWCGGGQRRHCRCAHPRQSVGCHRRGLSARMDHGRQHHGEGVHRHFHRGMGFCSGLGLVGQD